MNEKFLFFTYLLEIYATYKGKKTKDVLKEWDEKTITKEIYENYFQYHQERIENAYEDIDSLMKTGKHLW